MPNYRELESYSEEEILRILSNALVKVRTRDRELIEDGTNERSLTHRLAVYLEQDSALAGWHVDCEYNRLENPCEDGRSEVVSKRVQLTSSEDPLVLPDVIVHRRRTRQNLLVVEAKRMGMCSGDDAKLLAYWRDPRFRYRFAAFVEFSGDIAPRMVISG